MLFWILKYTIGVPVLRLIMRPKMFGAEHVPAQGCAIFAINHISSGDTFTLPLLLRRHVTFIGKQELFSGRGVKRLLGWFLRSMGQIPIDTHGGKSAAAGLRPLVDLLADGHLVGIFPEGTRSPDGRMYRFHTGVARVALEAHAPVLPVGMTDTYIRRGFLGLPNMSRARIKIGAPLDFSEYFDRQDDPAVLRWVSDQIAREVQALTGQVYVDVYGSLVKRGELTTSDADAHILPYPGAGQAPPPTNSELARAT